VAAHVQDAIDEVSALLTQTHRGVEDFTFDTRQELAESIENTARSTRLTGGLIAGISLISLIVGGILGLAAALGMTHLIKFTTVHHRRREPAGDPDLERHPQLRLRRAQRHLSRVERQPHRPDRGAALRVGHFGKIRTMTQPRGRALQGVGVPSPRGSNQER
jgi:hypothetical protein